MGQRGVTPNGKLIRTLRLKKHFTQNDVANQMHCHKNTITNIERGVDCSMAMIEDYATVLGVEDPEILLIQEEHDKEVGTVLVLSLKRSQYKSLEDAWKSVAPVLDRANGRFKTIRLEYGSIVMTFAVDDAIVRALRTRRIRAQLVMLDVFKVELFRGAKSKQFSLVPTSSIPNELLPSFPSITTDINRFVYDRISRTLHNLRAEDIGEILSDVWVHLLSPKRALLGRVARTYRPYASEDEELVDRTEVMKYLKSVVATMLKRRRRRKKLSTTRTLEDWISFESKSDALDEIEERDNRMRKVHSALARISSQQREIIIMHFFEGLTLRAYPRTPATLSVTMVN